MPKADINKSKAEELARSEKTCAPASQLLPSDYWSFELDGGVFGNVRIGRRTGTSFGNQVKGQVQQGGKE
jgi:hypothetical protein